MTTINIDKEKTEEYLAYRARIYNVMRDKFIAAIIAAAEIGMTQREIAKAIGRSYSYVASVLKKHGVTYEKRVTRT